MGSSAVIWIVSFAQINIIYIYKEVGRPHCLLIRLKLCSMSM